VLASASGAVLPELFLTTVFFGGRVIGNALAATVFPARGFLVRGFTTFALIGASAFADDFGALLVVTVFLQKLMRNALTRSRQAVPLGDKHGVHAKTEPIGGHALSCFADSAWSHGSPILHCHSVNNNIVRDRWTRTYTLLL
jgi:hypothetical protein